VRRRAEKGDAQAQFELGCMYSNGFLSIPIPKNDTEAVKWIGKAAEPEHADAQGTLSGMYEHGRGIPQDYAEAYGGRVREDRSDCSLVAPLHGLAFSDLS